LKFKEGDRVAYSKTGTTGKIIQIHQLDGKIWAELDTTGLLYEEKTLEPVIAKGSIEKLDEGQKSKRAKREYSELEIKDEGKIDTSGSVSGGG